MVSKLHFVENWWLKSRPDSTFLHCLTVFSGVYSIHSACFRVLRWTSEHRACLHDVVYFNAIFPFYWSNLHTTQTVGRWRPTFLRLRVKLPTFDHIILSHTLSCRVVAGGLSVSFNQKSYVNWIRSSQVCIPDSFRPVVITISSSHKSVGES